jgi:two-component system nitrogen regulation sensor histidine kinase GlnL
MTNASGPYNSDTMTSTDFHKQLLDHLSTALVLVDAGLRVRYINSAAQALFELSDSRSEGMRIDQLFPSHDQLFDELQTALQQNNPHTHRDITLTSVSRDEQLHVDLVVTPLMDEPEPSLLLEFHELNRILRITREEGLISAQQTSQALIRGLAHEIKNPLGGVRGAAQLLARELGDSSLEEYTNIIIAEADRLRDLVDRMLGSHRQPELHQLNIHEVLEHVRALVEAEVGSRLTIARDYDPSLPDITGDRSQLIQAVLNIVRNAVQATENQAGERIISLHSRIQRQFTIGTQRHRLVCRVDIKDNGAGVPADFEGSLFVPMISGRADGTGLGLAISQSIINRHQGVIEYSREADWTVFTLYIPMDKTHGS